MASNFKIVPSDSAFQPELDNAGVKLVIVDFFATWWGQSIIYMTRNEMPIWTVSARMLDCRMLYSLGPNPLQWFGAESST